MSKADPTDPAVIDTLSALDDLGPDHRHQPAIVPDHGRQPRRPNRPTAAIYRLDPHNTYRPANDPYVRSLHDDGEDGRLFSRERKIIQLLTDTAKFHAPRLSYLRDPLMEDAIVREGIMSAVRFIASELHPDAQARVLAAFNTILRDEVAQHRKNRRVTKM
jgi:hypothetical protein